jgi:hypothetical protein
VTWIKNYEVTAEHRAIYPCAVELRIGDKVVVTEKVEGGWVWCISKDEREAWVPKEYLSRKGNEGTVLIEYSSAELNVKSGEMLTCSKELDGWLWCINQKGKEGWVPRNKIKRLEDTHE